jgi:microcystin-dependent protein
MACDCNKTNYACNGVTVSSDCVVWRGGAIPALGICNGDPITFVELQIIEKIKDLLALDAKQLEDFDISTCASLSQKLLGKDPTLVNLLQVMWTNQCTLSEAIKAIENRIDAQQPVPYPFQLGCVTPAGNSSTSDAILQGVINKLCTLQTQVNALTPSVDTLVQVKIAENLGKMLKGLGNRGIVKSGKDSDITFLFNSFVPPFTPLAYYGPVTNFDATGKGLPGTPYEGWYLLSGYNGVPDVRGRTLVAAVKNIPGTALDTEVDPAKAENSANNYLPGQKFGTSSVKLTVAQLPAHSHGVNDPGHSHSMPYPTPEKFSGSKFDAANEKNLATRTTAIAKTGVTINNAGGDQPHDNRQPSFAVTGYIMRID